VRPSGLSGQCEDLSPQFAAARTATSTPCLTQAFHPRTDERHFTKSIFNLQVNRRTVPLSSNRVGEFRSHRVHHFVGHTAQSYDDDCQLDNSKRGGADLMFSHQRAHGL
jgi:hypothetical protein